MTVRSIGAASLARLMRADRIRDLDTSWLLFGPVDETASEDEEPVEDVPPAWRYAAE